MSFIYEARNKVEELSGQAKEKTGEATGDKDLQAEGEKDQAAGNVKDAGEKIKDVFWPGPAPGRPRHPVLGCGVSRWPWRYRATHARDGPP